MIARLKDSFSLVTKVFDNCFGQMIIHVRHKNGHITNCLTDRFFTCAIVDPPYNQYSIKVLVVLPSDDVEKLAEIIYRHSQKTCTAKAEEYIVDLAGLEFTHFLAINDHNNQNCQKRALMTAQMFAISRTCVGELEPKMKAVRAREQE